MRLPLLLAGAALLAGGCSPAQVAPDAATRARTGTAPGPAAAYGDSCAPAIARAREVPTDPLIRPPVPMDTAGLLPPPLPAKLRRRAALLTLDMTVDSAGGVTGVQVSPDLSADFTQKLLAQYRRVRMSPALLRGCGVPGRAQLMLEFTDGPPRAN